ncbi:hypothetical protein LP417_34085 (plasmid) [Polaromonas sp. P1-6]|nr:hypothetical protein LP417_34085 [Polaromonas sp. P1-6]
MRKASIALPASKPRNGVVRALISKLGGGAGRHMRDHHKRQKTTDNKDLAQRVRDVGEW